MHWLVGCAVLVAFGFPLAVAQAVPEQVHVTLTTGSEDVGKAPPEASRLALTWHVPEAYLPHHTPQARFTVNDGAMQTAAAMEVGRTLETVRPGNEFFGLDPDGPDLIYAAFVEAPPGARVTYEVGEPSLGWSAPATVHRPPGPNETLRVAFLGDIGGYTLEGEDDATQRALRDAILERRPDLLVLPGDLAYSNSDGNWGRWMRMMEPLISQVPVMAVPGNHEYQTSVEEYDQFKARFVLPVQVETEADPTQTIGVQFVRNRLLAEEFFGFSAGPAYFVGLNSDRACSKGPLYALDPRTLPPCPSGTPMPEPIAFLHDALEDAREVGIPWLVTFFHHPPYSWANHGDDAAVKALWVPTLEAFSVDLVVTGHEHLYERTYPMRGGVPVVASDAGRPIAQGQGPIYVITGGGGRSLYEMKPPPYPAYLASWNSTYHYTWAEFSQGSMRVEAVALDGRIIDQFVVERGGPPGPSPASSGNETDLPAGVAFTSVVLAMAAATRRRHA